MTNTSNSGLNCLASRVNAKEAEIFKLFDKVFNEYSPENTIVSFNGGKDCTVILHMLDKYYQQRSDFKDQTLDVLYIQGDHTFGEVEEFVRQCSENYKINLVERKGAIKSVLEDICKQRPELQAVFMGCRRTDPYCGKLRTMEKTDAGWPDLIRINPILDWTLRDVWHYIFVKKVPYCSLYDLGYTSLGNTINTHQNPHLQVVDEDSGEVSYRPAYELLDDDLLERAGRS